MKAYYKNIETGKIFATPIKLKLVSKDKNGNTIKNEDGTDKFFTVYSSDEKVILVNGFEKFVPRPQNNVSRPQSNVEPK